MGALSHTVVVYKRAKPSYKIKRADHEEHERVKQQTREEDWPVYFADDAFNNSPGIIYIPVETADDLRTASTKLREHFDTYGSSYGVTPDDR
jgi:hypothetical protein